MVGIIVFVVIVVAVISFAVYHGHRYHSNNGGELFGSLLIGGIGLVLLIVILGGAYHSYAQVKHMTVTICSKANVYSGNQNQQRVYTSNGTFQVSDHWLHGTTFNSADLYGRIQTGKTYDLTYYGWRIGWMSEMPNIIGGHVAPKNQAIGSCQSNNLSGNLG